MHAQPTHVVGPDNDGADQRQVGCRRGPDRTVFVATRRCSDVTVRSRPQRRAQRFGGIAAVIALSAAFATLLLTPSAVASSSAAVPTTLPAPSTSVAATTTTMDEQRAELLAKGAAVFGSFCANCHQAGGVGLPGQYPPLRGNEHVQDAAYVRSVLANGKTGALVVNGETYDGVMPKFASLPGDDVDAVIAYIQSGFASATPAPAATTPGFVLPSPTWRGLAFSLVVLAGFFALVAPGLAPLGPGRKATWGSAWARGAVIVLATAVLTAAIPSFALRSEAVSSMSRPLQDLIGSGLWAAGLVLLLVGLYWLHKRREL